MTDENYENESVKSESILYPKFYYGRYAKKMTADYVPKDVYIFVGHIMKKKTKILRLKREKKESNC